MSAESRRWRAALFGLLLCLWVACVGAHPMPESQVWVDSTPDGLNLTLRLPLNRLEYGFGQPLADEPAHALTQHGAALAAYMQQHVRARGGALGEGPSWVVGVPQLQVIGSDASAELEARLPLQAPPGADARTGVLVIDAITHEVRTHRIQVFLRKDWAAGVVSGVPVPLGELNHERTSLAFKLGAVTPGAALTQLFREGVQHILEGSDHQAFLLLLLLVAPLTAQARAWRAARQPGDALRHAAWVISAFTLGHTVTLALGSLRWLAPPAAAVEVAVAFTIAVAAVHAWRPLLRTGEAPMALAFGLIHGLAFSASLTGAGLTPAQHALALVAFNLGIEAAQLGLVLLLLPPLMQIAQAAPARFKALRCALAAGALLLAALWCAERVGFDPWAAWPWLPASAAWTPALPLAVWGLALMTVGAHRQRRE